jgi:hypothetical protein
MANEIAWGNVLLIVSFSYYMLYVVQLIVSSKFRKQVKIRNKKLDRLRKIPVKTLEQQKKFIAMRYGNDVAPFKFQFGMLWDLIISAGRFALIYFFVSQIFLKTGIVVPLYLAIILIIIMPILLTLALKIFGIQGDNNLLSIIK